ncbi:hypothetical protein SD71_01250 [Cohnella kolymensis]|uniref:HD-GYP domain-containing protein n=1 Tax=Cohnella kolymensis TaxID=1590652 RepID=A0ABR5A9K0_9BACL|nr:hypothetical protein SD71_01250 [Cohnella kolymensis]
MTPKLLEQASNLGIRLTKEDCESAGDTLIMAADATFDELDTVFREAGETGSVMIKDLRQTALPMLIETLSTGSLIQFLVHLRRKDDITLTHSIGVAALSIMLGRWLNLSSEELTDLAVAALLHDIGKLRIERHLLNKPGKLTVGEYEEIKKHTVYGYEMLRNSPDIKELCALPALRHHERLNGTGYPNRLTGDAIDKFSRLIAVTDVFHAMSSNRSYKDRIPFYHVIREMHASAFGQFDPDFTLVFLSKMMETLIGTEVVLSNGKTAVIVALNPSDPFRPLVRVNGRFLDLGRAENLHIMGYSPVN